MYRCDVCHAVTQPKQARLVHTLYREVPGQSLNNPLRKEIAEEIPVCLTCQTLLEAGYELGKLRRKHERKRQAAKSVQGIGAIPSIKTGARVVAL